MLPFEFQQICFQIYLSALVVYTDKSKLLSLFIQSYKFFIIIINPG